MSHRAPGAPSQPEAPEPAAQETAPQPTTPASEQHRQAAGAEPVGAPSPAQATGSAQAGPTGSGPTQAGSPQSTPRQNPHPTNTPTAAAASARDLYKVYGKGDTQVRALDGVSVDLGRSQFTAIMGPSGSGKSTLMHCLAGLDSASKGSIKIGDTELVGLPDKKLTKLRRDRIGFVFQAFNLVPTLTALENITLPLDIAGRKVNREWMTQVVHRLGLDNRLGHRPTELSGGQQQRVACARALVSQPEIIFGDEPTGNLDTRASQEVLSILRSSVDDMGQTVVMVTHEPTAAAFADRVIFLRDGQIVDELTEPNADSVYARMRSLEA